MLLIRQVGNHWLFCLITLLTAIRCAPSEVKDKFEAPMVVKELQQMFSDYHAAIADHGLSAEFEFLDSSSSFFWVPPGFDRALSYDSVRSILEENASMYHEIEFHWDTLQIIPLTNDLANFTGIVGGYMVDTNGVKSAVRIIESGTAIKRRDGWKLLTGQSAVLP